MNPKQDELTEEQKEERANNSILNLVDESKAFYGEGGISETPAFGGTDDADLLTDQKISLYLPRAIQIQDTVTYDNAFQLGLIGGAGTRCRWGDGKARSKKARNGKAKWLPGALRLLTGSE